MTHVIVRYRCCQYNNNIKNNNNNNDNTFLDKSRIVNNTYRILLTVSAVHLCIIHRTVTDKLRIEDTSANEAGDLGLARCHAAIG